MPEIDRVDRAGQLINLGARLERGAAIEDAHLVRSGATRYNYITLRLLELARVDLTVFLRRKQLVEGQIDEEFSRAIIPELHLVFGRVGACQHEVVVDVDGVTADVGAHDGAHRTRLPNVPHLHVLVPST